MTTFRDQIVQIKNLPEISPAAWSHFSILRDQILLFEKFGYHIIHSVENMLKFLPEQKTKILDISGKMQLLALLLSFKEVKYFSIHHQQHTAKLLAEYVAGLRKERFPRFIISSIRHLPFLQHSVNLIFSFHLLRSLPDPSGMLAEMRRIMTPDGKIIFKDFSRNGIKLLRKMRNDSREMENPVGWSMFEIADYFDQKDYLVTCIREEFEITLLVEAPD